MFLNLIGTLLSHTVALCCFFAEGSYATSELPATGTLQLRVTIVVTSKVLVPAYLPDTFGAVEFGRPSTGRSALRSIIFGLPRLFKDLEFGIMAGLENIFGRSANKVFSFTTHPISQSA